MDEQDIQQEILNAKAQLELSDVQSSTSTNPLSNFRYNLIPDLDLNGFDKYSVEPSNIHSECEEILKCSLQDKDFEMFEQVLWMIKDEKNQYTRKALIMKYISLCCTITDEKINTAVDQLLEYLHENIDATWHYHIGFLFDLLHLTGANVDKLVTLIENVGLKTVLNDVQLKSKLNYAEKSISSASVDKKRNCIRRVFRIILSLGYFQVEKLNSTLSSENYIFLFLLGFYLQLNKRFQDVNIIHLGRRLMVNSLTLLPNTDWNEKRDAIVECLYEFSGKNTYIIELFLKTNERTVRIRTQLALLHLKRLVNMIEHEKKSEAMIIEEIIKTKLHPRLFERQSDFLDCVRLLADIIDSYPYEQQIEYLDKLHAKIEPFSKKDHKKFLNDEEKLILYDNCQRWVTMLKPHIDKSKRFKQTT